MKKETTLFLAKNASHQLFVNKFGTPFFGVVQNSRQLLQYGFLFVLLLPFCSKLNATNDVFRTILRDSIPQKNAVAPTSNFRWEYSEDQVNWQFYSNEEYIHTQVNKTTYYRRWVSLRSNPKSIVDVNQVLTFTAGCGSMGAYSTSCGLNNGSIEFLPDPQTTETSFSLEQYNSTTGQFLAFQTISSGFTYNLSPGTYRVVWGGGTCIAGPVTINSSTIPAGPPIASATASNQFDCTYGNMGFQVVMYSPDPGLQYRINGGAWQSDPNFSGFTTGTYLFEAQTVISSTCTSGISSYQDYYSEVEPPVIQNVNLTNVTDCTLNNARASVTLSQGTGIQYRINSGAWQWSNVFTNLSKGNYWIEAQTSGNITCSSGYYSFSVDETQGLKITGHSLSNLGACGSTATNVSITLQSNATAFSPSVQYKMGNGAWQSSAVFSGLSAGTYAFFIKAADGCTTGTTSNYSVTISNSNVPVISSVTTSNDNDCSLNNVALKVIVQDTTVGIKYRINGGAWGNASTFTGLTSGTFLLEAAPSSNLSCIASFTKTVTETGSVTISSITVANQTDCTPNNVMLTAVHNGGTQTGLEFQLVGTGVWQANNPQFTGLATNTYSIQARIRNSTCTYPVNVKTITVTETLYPTIASDTVTGIKDCVKNNARATLRLKNSSLLAQYRITNLNNTWQTSNVFSNLTTGVYQVQVAAQGNTTCIQNYTLNVDEGLGSIDSLTVTNSNDCINRNIQLKVNYTASPLSNIQFRINGGAYQSSPIFTGLTTGTFLVGSNTANGCKSSRSTGTITEVLVPEITNLQASNDADCIVGNMNAIVQYNTNGVSLGTITFRLNGGAWQSSVNYTNLPSGTYLVEASSTKCFAPKQVTLNEKKPPIIQDVVITNSADTCASRLDFKVILSNFDSTQQYQYAIASGPTWQASNQFSSQYPFSYNFLVKSTTTTCTGTTLIKDFTGAKRGAKYSSITLANDNDCITGNMIATVYTDAIAATPTDAWYPHTRDQWFRADNGAWVQYPSKLNNLSAGSHSIQVRYKNCIDSARVTLSERIPIRVGSVAIGNQNDCIKGNATATITALNTLGSIRYALGSGAYQLSNPTFSALSSGNYLARVLDDGGCKDSLAFSVLENEPPLASITGVNALCAGQSTTLSASGGTAYLWSTGATTAAITITPSFNTTYTVTVTQNGCSAVVSKTIAVTPAPTISGVSSLCTGQSTTLTASTGSSYLWSTGATTAAITITPATSTTYTVTVTQNGCSLVASQVVTVSSYPTPVITGASPICSGQQAALTASGGTSYLWSTGATTASINPTPIANTTYSVTVSQNGCSATTSKLISVTALPTPLITGVQNICAGQSTTLTASGGTTYLWSTGATTAAVSLTPSATTTYSVTVTQNGCSAVTSKQVNVTPYPTISGVTSICSFQSTSLTASTGSSYTWSTGSRNATINVTPTTNTTYSVTVTQNGCTAVASQLVTVTAYPSPTISGGSNICAGQSTTLSVGAAAGYSYSWSTGETTSSISATPASTTTYSVTVSQNGCASGSSKSVSVIALPTPAISGVSSICTGQSATLTASGGTAYQWSTGATTAAITATPSSTTTYTVTVTQNGCSATANKQLSVTPLPTISGVSTVCAGQPAVLTASSGSTYLWSTGATTASISPTPATNTTYNVTVTLNGCSASASKLVSVTPLPTPTISGSSTICAGQSANLTASGGTAYAWSTGATTAAISPSPAFTTTYTVTVTQNGCSAVASQVVNVTPLPTPIITGVSTVCAGQPANLTASGGTTYAWSTGATTAAISPNPSTNTNYTVTVTQNGCSAVTSQVVGVNPYPTPSISGVSTVCNGQPAALTASGGNGYQWSIGATTASISPTPATNTTYTVTVTLNGCSASAIKSVAVTPLPTASIAGSATICAGEPATLTASGGTAYAWSTGATTAAISPSPAVTTTYTVTVTQNGCSAVASQVVNVTPLPTPIISGVSTICAGQPANLTASGGTAYVWSTGATSTSISPSPAATTTYSVSVSQNGCTATASKQVTVTPLPSAVITGVSSICDGQPANLTASGGTAYAWSTGAITAAITPTPSTNTTYTVTVTSNGCTSTASQAVVVKAIPLVAINGPGAVCKGQLVGLSSVYGADSFIWSNGATTGSIIVPPGAYSLTVITNGCSNTAGISVYEIQTTVASISGPTSICLGSTARLTASSVSGTYQWSNGSTASFIDVTPTAPGTYQYSVNSFTNGCPGGPGVHTLTVPAPLTLGYQLQNDQDCILGNTNIVPIALNAQGAVSYLISPEGTTDFSTDLRARGSGRYTLSAIDGKGCVASTVVSIAEAPIIKLNYTLTGNSSDCIVGNVNVTLNSLNSRGTTSFRLNDPLNGTVIPANFNSGSAQYKVFVKDDFGCTDSINITVQENVPPKITAENLLFQEDCILGNTKLAIQAVDDNSNLLYYLKGKVPQSNNQLENLPEGITNRHSPPQNRQKNN